MYNTTPTKAEICCSRESERLSTVRELSHSNQSDDDYSEPGGDHPNNNDDGCHQNYDCALVKQTGSPHPIKNCYTRVPFTSVQEQILKRALEESKTRDSNRICEQTGTGEHDERRRDRETKDNETLYPSASAPGEIILMDEMKVSPTKAGRTPSENSTPANTDEAISTIL
ncbi:hypothetical protein SK128_025810 [Halocaridina rubra]|uniref:Uncharacterized protein n=1 Tax=Halocaridina rubra TaxID=373956 RepID=A0AAN8WME0_HALRR